MSKQPSATPKMKNDYYQNLLNKEKEIKRNGMHSFHRYFGKLIPAIPAFAIKNFTNEGDYILDCFSGSGTSLLEAKYLNRNAYGTDLNPLAVFMANIKTLKIDKEDVAKGWLKIQIDIKKDRKKYSVKDEPYCVNIDHWFKDFAKNDLLKLRAHILKLESGNVKNFLLGCFSAFLRGVSNADPQHVFPGYSKRMRKLDEEGKRNIDVMASFDRAVKKRMGYLDALPKNKAKIKAITADSKKLPKEIKDISLVIVNPPYISSIRYLETMKIEMGWLGFIKDQQEYLTLDKTITGTERFYKADLQNIPLTGLSSLDVQIKKLQKNSQHKMARVVSNYFNDMRVSISEMSRVLKKGGHLVIKISDSKVRNENITTSKHFVEIAENLGLKTVACFKDTFDQNSRSLLTTRNSYSGIMNHDWILIFKK